MPNAISRVRSFEGNLLYEDFGLSAEDKASLTRSVSVAFHAGGPHETVLEYCQDLPQLSSVAAVSSIFRHRGKVTEHPQNEKLPDLPIAIVRLPLIGPAHKEPMPGYVEVLRGSTAFIVGAGFAYGDSTLPAEVIPIDLAVNTMIAAAWEVGTYVKSERKLLTRFAVERRRGNVVLLLPLRELYGEFFEIRHSDARRASREN